MNCNSYTALDIVQCTARLNVGTTTDTNWTLRIVNTATGHTQYIVGTTTSVYVMNPDIAPNTTYALSLVNATMIPYKAQSSAGTVEVDTIYVRVAKVFDANGAIIMPSAQWVVLPQ